MEVVIGDGEYVDAVETISGDAEEIEAAEKDIKTEEDLAVASVATEEDLAVASAATEEDFVAASVATEGDTRIEELLVADLVAIEVVGAEVEALPRENKEGELFV